MNYPIHILLQTSIPAIEDDWNINRFSLLLEYLASVTNDEGKPAFDVTARSRITDAEGNDPILSNLDTN